MDVSSGNRPREKNWHITKCNSTYIFIYYTYMILLHEVNESFPPTCHTVLEIFQYSVGWLMSMCVRFMRSILPVLSLSFYPPPTISHLFLPFLNSLLFFFFCSLVYIYIACTRAPLYPPLFLKRLHVHPAPHHHLFSLPLTLYFV